VQVEGWLTTTGVVQLTVVVVLRGLTVMPDALLELSACAVSAVAGTNVALMLAVPVVEPTKVVVQFADLEEPEMGARVH
jgi:hypothetical protein